VIPFEANCLTVSNPIPLFDPVTTAYLEKQEANPEQNEMITEGNREEIVIDGAKKV
jgi:hypothetical protein